MARKEWSAKLKKKKEKIPTTIGQNQIKSTADRLDAMQYAVGEYMLFETSLIKIGQFVGIARTYPYDIVINQSEVTKNANPTKLLRIDPEF